MVDICLGTYKDAEFFEEQEPWDLKVSFGRGSRFKYYVLFIDNERASIAVAYNGVQLLRLYTLNKFRRQGLGEKLARHVIDKIIKSNDYAEVELTLESGEFWISFVAKNDFDVESDGLNVMVFRRE